MSKLACAYIRVSTMDQDEYSPDAQIRLLKEYASNNDYEIAKIYKDIGISGRKAEKRPEFMEMIAQCKSKEHPYDAILVWKFSRFARNQEESIVYKSLLKKNNVEVVSVSEPLPDGVIGGLVERIFEWMDEYYSIRLSGEVKRGMTQKALSGGYNGQPPIGYNKEKGTDTIPTIDAYYGDMVRLVFHLWVEEKRPLADIAYILNEKGYRTRRGNKWETRNISDMIQNPFYIGKIRWNNTENRARKLSGSTIIVDGRHTPLIDEPTFHAANERYNQISATKSHKKRSAMSEKHWLSGMLKCSVCGATLGYFKGPSRDGLHYYPSFICSNVSKGICNTRNTISVKKAELYVMDALKNMTGNDDITVIEAQKFEQDTSALKLQIKATEAKLKRAKEAYIDGIDTIEEYKENKTQIESALEKLKYDLAAATSSYHEPVTTQHIKRVYEFIDNSNDNVEKANALREIVDHITYDRASDNFQVFLH